MKIQSLDCRISQIGQNFSVDESADSWYYQEAEPSVRANRVGPIPRGSLAPVNCALAINAVQEIVELNASTIEAGLAGLSFSGRMEAAQFHGSNVVIDVVIDVAQNPAGSLFLAEQLVSRMPARRYVAIVGLLEDKDAPGIFGNLAQCITRWIAVPTEGPRGLDAVSLQKRLRGEFDVIAAFDLSAALEMAASYVQGDDAIVILGSFHVVEQARNLLHLSVSSGQLEPDGYT